MHEIIREMFKKDFYDERQEGIHEANERMAIDMLKDKKPLAEIKKYSRLAEDVIRGLAASLGVSVM